MVVVIAVTNAVKTNCVVREQLAALVLLFCVYFVAFPLPKISCLAPEMPSCFRMCVRLLTVSSVRYVQMKIHNVRVHTSHISVG